MPIESIIALTIAIFILGATPGPGVFAIVARALAQGFRPTLVFIVGIIAGDLVYLLLAAMGLSVLATQYGPAFALLKILGGLYLVYLGVQTWRSAKRVEGLMDTGLTDAGLVPVQPRHTGRGFLSGLSLTLGNPKAMVFYVAFLPAFMDLSALSAVDLVEASAVVSVTLFVVMAGYAYMAARARAFFKSRQAIQNLHRGAGALMIGAGGAVAAS